MYTGGFLFMSIHFFIFFYFCFFQALRDIGIHHLRLLLMLGQLAALMLLPIWVVLDFRRIVSDPELVNWTGSLNL